MLENSVGIITILREYPHPSLNESLKGSGKYFCVNKKKHFNTSFVTVTIDFLLCMYKYSPFFRNICNLSIGNAKNTSSWNMI
jgi:hypothetical protein